MGSVAWTYDPKEGLSSFLTPVYFNSAVLVKYLYDPRTDCEFASETYGWINASAWSLVFGINGGGTVFAWLGDLRSLPANEQTHWARENIAPQGDMSSEFFEAQINVVFTPPPLAVSCLNTIQEWNGAFGRKYGLSLYKPRPLAKRLQEVRRYRNLIINRVDDFKVYVSELNEIINESVDTSALRAFLIAQSVPLQTNWKGNKLLERVYVDVLGDQANLIAPFYHLYDLRLWADHDMGDDNLIAVAAAYGLGIDDYEAIMQALLTNLETSTQALIDRYG